MKTLNKLNINPEKVIKNEELVTLRGGYGSGATSFSCLYSDGTPPPEVLGCVTFSSCNSNAAWDWCVAFHPTTNQMGHSCGNVDPSCMIGH
jgi:hypothetical protein